MSDRQGLKAKAYRKAYEASRNKEYNKSYLEAKKRRLEKPNNYTMTKLVLIRDIWRSKDLYKALGLFFLVQFAIILISTGAKHPSIAPVLNIIAALFGLIAIIWSIKEGKRRQAFDDTRRRIRLDGITGTIILMLLAIYGLAILFNTLGIASVAQPNQESLNTLVAEFPVVMVFVMVLVAPIMEEIVFRELLPYVIGPSYVSFIISSLFFVALHAPFGIVGWLNYGVLSAGFLTVRLRNNNIFAAMIIHIIWNALSILV